MEKKLFVTILLGLAVILFCEGPEFGKAQAPASAALSGQISSQEEGPMEGVLVSAKREGSTVTVTVASDARGRYSFPRTKLEPGRYSLRIRATGYELNNPGPVEVTAQKAAQLDLRLSPTRDLAYQLTNAEWLLSIPGTEEQKKLFWNCVQCHTLERIVRSRYNATEFKQVLERMGTYYQGSFPLRIQKAVFKRAEPSEQLVQHAEYLRTINLSSVSRWEYPLKTLPRPKGKATRVIVTEYDLPRPDSQPHDAAVDAEGVVWYADFGDMVVGKLDPRTAQVTEYPVPVIKPGFPRGLQDVQIDKEGNVWIGTMVQGGIAKFDRKTEKVQAWGLPKEVDSERAHTSKVAPQNQDVDGKVWLKDSEWMHRLDVRSGKIESVDPYRDYKKERGGDPRTPGGYGLASDSHNNAYLMTLDAEFIVKVDAKTGQGKLYPTPTRNSGPRRGNMDSQDRLWFAEFRANQIGMFDTKTERFQEWALPTPWSNPYDAMVDKNGEVWSGGMTTDRIVRLNAKTGESIEYLLPRTTNIRRVEVDNSTTPVTFWVGNNHGASILKLEPLE